MARRSTEVLFATTFAVLSFGVGCQTYGPSPSGTEGPVAKAAATLSVSDGDAGTASPTIASPDIGSFAVYATEAVELQIGAWVTGCNVGVQGSSGPFLAGGAAAYLESGANIQSSQTLYASSVYLNPWTSVGPLDTNTLMGNSRATYASVSAFPSMPAPPGLPRATAGTTPVTLGWGVSQTLASGAYGGVTVSPGATLSLTGGTYVFSSLTLEIGAALTVSAPTVISVTGAAHFDIVSSLGPASGSGLTAKSLAVYFDSSSEVDVGLDAQVKALFVAPNALVTVSTSGFTGAIAAAQVLMHPAAGVTCEDGFGSLRRGQSGVASVAGGVKASSPSYVMITTTGQSPGGNGSLSSPRYSMTGGIVAATQGN